MRQKDEGEILKLELGAVGEKVLVRDGRESHDPIGETKWGRERDEGMLSDVRFQANEDKGVGGGDEDGGGWTTARGRAKRTDVGERRWIIPRTEKMAHD